MRVTTWAEYSLIISLHLARQARASRAPVSAREVADAEQLPADYVEQILLRLRRGGLVTSVRGARGGYLLARPAGEVTVRDVMVAAQQQVFEVNCDTHPVDAGRCGSGTSCSIRPMWFALQHRIDEFLGGITLADLLEEEGKVQGLVAMSGRT